jgi:hypothetical protein
MYLKNSPDIKPNVDDITRYCAIASYKLKAQRPKLAEQQQPYRGLVNIVGLCQLVKR